jgi:uncharacterized YccA/Bax inhibitor family protein
MALFEKTSNPTMKDDIYRKVASAENPGEAMTVNGAVVKTGLLLSLTVLAASYTWYLVMSGATASISTWVWGGAICGFVLAIIISFVPRTAPYLSLLYAVAEGFFLGAISAMFEMAFAESFPGIVPTAVSATLLTAAVMLFAYRTGLIKVTDRLRSVIIVAMSSIMLFYLMVIVLNLFNVSTPFYHSSSWLSIGISAVIVVVAALKLLLDFDFIEKGAQAGAPKYMEWYGAFALMVTLIWLYLEILRLLSKIARR